jgi:DnaJ-class molecular chaperone
MGECPNCNGHGFLGMPDTLCQECGGSGND